jgi:hypothetical protein
VLVPWLDVLHLHPGGTVQLYGILDVFAPLPYLLDSDPGLFEHLAHGRVVGKLVFLYMLGIHTRPRFHFRARICDEQTRIEVTLA